MEEYIPISICHSSLITWSCLCLVLSQQEDLDGRPDRRSEGRSDGRPEGRSDTRSDNLPPNPADLIKQVRPAKRICTQPRFR